MQILEDRDNGLHAVFTQQQSGDRMEGVLSVLERIQQLEWMPGIQRVQQIEHLKYSEKHGKRMRCSLLLSVK